MSLIKVFKLLLSARTKWRRLDGSNHIAEVIRGITFKDNINQFKPWTDQPVTKLRI